MGNAPHCKACNNPTWSPSGYCHLHGHMAGSNGHQQQQQSAREAYAPQSDGRYLTDPHAISKSFTKVFDEIDIATPYNMNAASEQTIKGFVSLEALRRFPESDVQDPAERAQILQKIESEIIDEVQTYEATNYSDDMMIGFRDSSEDQYGMGTDEAMIIASFAMRREWEMGRAAGETENSRGIPYSLPLEKYMLHHRAHLQNVARVEFRRNLAYYPQIIKDATGHLPQNSSSVLNENMRQHLLDDSIPHEQKLSRDEYRKHEEQYISVNSGSSTGREVLAGLGAIAGAFAFGAGKAALNNAKNEVKAMNNFRKGATQRIEDMEAEQMRRKDEEYRKMMHRKRRWS